MTKDIALHIGPADTEIEALRPVYARHRHRYGPDTWAHRYFVEGIDDRPPAGDPHDAVEAMTDAELPGTPAYNAGAFAEIGRAN